MQEIAQERRIVVPRRAAPADNMQKQTGSSMQAQPLITAIMRITRQSLKAADSSILLCEEKGQKMIFVFADGYIGEQIRRLKISKNSGIAGWVARNGKPLIVNDTEENAHFNRFADEITGHTTRSLICVPLIVKSKILGVIEVLNKEDNNFSDSDLNILTSAADKVAWLIQNIQDTQSNSVTHRDASKMLASVVESRESHLPGHGRRVSEYVLTAAEGLPLSRDDIKIIQYAALLHDIGKVGIPESVLKKTDTLSEEEQAMVGRHPITGFNLLNGIPFLQDAGKVLLHHHERYDGRGYPKRLKSDDIPIGARIIAVADAFDNMTAEQSRHTPVNKKDALIKLHGYAGSKFDPAAVRAFNSGLAGSVGSAAA